MKYAKEFFMWFGMLTMVGLLSYFLYSPLPERWGSNYYVTPELRAAVNHFFVEAEIRGLKVPYKGLTIVLGNFDDANNPAETLGASFGHRTIWISRKMVAMDQGEDTESCRLYIEYVVFHELAHALLGRDHKDGTVSLMNTYCESAELYSSQPLMRQMMINEIFLPAQINKLK